MGARPTGATATNTAPSQGSSSTPTEGRIGRGLRGERSQPEDVHFLTFHSALAVRLTLPIATDPQLDCFFSRRSALIQGCGSVVICNLLIHMFHCIQGAYAAILMDASNETVTVMSCVTLRCSNNSDSEGASPSLLSCHFNFKSGNPTDCCVCKCAV